MPTMNKTRYALLGVLNMGAYSGYDIRRGIEQSIGHFWHESFGQIYPILRKLVDEGLATAHTEMLPGRPARIVYTITDRGRAALDSWLRESIESIPVERNEFLLKLFFGSEVPLDISLQHIRDHQAQAVQVLDMFAQIEAMLETQFAAANDRPFWLATLRYGKVQAEAVVRWCNDTLDHLSVISDQRSATDNDAR
jgi:DNA-binding PadR family transcriptional regulator